MFNPQLDRRGELLHLLDTEGMPRRLLERLLEAADAPPAPLSGPAVGVRVHLCLPPAADALRAAYAGAARDLGLAAKPLDASAGLARAASALPPGILVLRHASSGAADCVRRYAAPGLRVLNAGDGAHADPLPALALARALRRRRPELFNLTVALVGDLRHSAVGRSLAHALTTLGVPELRAAGPGTLLPEGAAQLGVRVCPDRGSALAGADAVVALPLEIERVNGAWLPSAREYAHFWGLSAGMLRQAAPGALLLPAGPLTPGLEVEADAAAALPLLHEEIARDEQALRRAALGLLAEAA